MTPDSAPSHSNRRTNKVPAHDALDTPAGGTRFAIKRPTMNSEAFGALSERFARFMGTPHFLVYMTIFVVVWLGWNTFMPDSAQFDPRALNYTLLTLILSLQASYAAPLILLAQNRQDDRDRVALEQDRQRAERALADTEYLAREVAALRIALRDVSTRDYVRSELRGLVEELREITEALPTHQHAGYRGDSGGGLDHADGLAVDAGVAGAETEPNAGARAQGDATAMCVEQPVDAAKPDGERPGQQAGRAGDGQVTAVTVAQAIRQAGDGAASRPAPPDEATPDVGGERPPPSDR